MQALTTVYLSSPQNPTDWEQYYYFRWLHLRKAWQQPVGSERDEHEADAFHVMAKTVDDRLVGVGRIHRCAHDTHVSAQIRYMAVAESEQNLGIGTLILDRLEQKANDWNVSEIYLNARNDYLGFYTRMGYQTVRPAETLFGTIHHTKMQKIIPTGQ